MCLITTQRKPILTTEDIVCYKYMFRYTKFFGNEDYDYVSILHGFKWKLNTVYETEFTFQTENFTYYDKKVRQKYRFTFFKLKSVSQGFHAFLTPDRIDNRDNSNLMKCHTVRCVIPSGSLVYYDKTGLIVSNKMKLIGKY